MTDEPEPPAGKEHDGDPPPAGPEDGYGAQEPWENLERDPDIPPGHMMGPDGPIPVEQRVNGEDPDGMPKLLEANVWSGQMLRDYEPVPREWIVKHRIPCGEVTLLTGPGGLGKSTLAIQLQVAMAGGLPWLGYETQRVASIGLYCEEDKDELARRFQAVRRRLGVDWDAFDAFIRYFPLKGHDVSLAYVDRFEDVVEAAPLLAEIDEYLDKWSARLAILDSLNRLFPGNENNRVQVTAFLRALEVIATRRQIAILLLAHPSKSALVDGSGYSGSTSWDSMVRARAYLSYQRVENPELLTPQELANPLLKLSWKKANYAAKSADIEIEISFDEAGPKDEPPIFARVPDDIVDGETFFAQVIDELHAAGLLPRPDGHGRSKHLFAPSLVFQHPLNKRRKGKGLRPLTSEQCVNLYTRMMTNGKLAVEEMKDGNKHLRRAVKTVPQKQNEGGHEYDEVPF